MPARRSTTLLRLIVDDTCEAVATEPHQRSFEAPTPTARPADRCEPWPVEGEETLQSLAVAAAVSGLSLELAAVVVVERALLAAELSAQTLDELPSMLDGEAEHARVTVELSEPLSAYLAALSGRRRNIATLPHSLVLPMRLTERILAWHGRPHVDATLLPSAIAWERASVLEGRTMSEWAAIRALSLELELA